MLRNVFSAIEMELNASARFARCGRCTVTGFDTIMTLHITAMSRISQRGFTLLELLVVMVIIGLLAGYVGPRFFSQIGKSEVKAARAQIDALEKALDQFRLDNGRYPTTEEGLKALVERPSTTSKWSGPYLKKAVPLDPWERPYIYKSPGEHGEYDLSSLGKDGQAGGTEEATDITNW
jgi:general secretion pathway protein G